MRASTAAQGVLEPTPHTGGNTSRVDTSLLIKLVEEQPDRTLMELARLYQERTGQGISHSWVSVLLGRAGIVRKK